MALVVSSPRRRQPAEYHHESMKWAGGGHGRVGDCGPEVEIIRRGIRAPRLTRELRILKAFDADLDDWRTLDPAEIAWRFHNVTDPEGRSLLGTAVFTGTAQASMKGSYWAPSFQCPGMEEVDCHHLVRPISCLHTQEKVPPHGAMQPTSQGFSLTCAGRCSALDACARLTHSASTRQVAVVRFTGIRDARNLSVRYGHPREDQLFLRTTYFKGFENIEMDINARRGDAIDQGGLIYTSGVGLLRGSLDEGALWFREPPKIDVLWVGLPARPYLAEQEQYAEERDRLEVSNTINRVFTWAATHGCDSLVLQPACLGYHQLQHPGMDFADIIHNVAHQYARYIPEVCVASDYPAHFESGWWEDFSAAVLNGRPHVEARLRVPPVGIPPRLAPKKEPAHLLERTRNLSLTTPPLRSALPTQRWPTHTARSWSTPRSGSRLRNSYL